MLKVQNPLSWKTICEYTERAWKIISMSNHISDSSTFSGTCYHFISSTI